MQDLCRPGAELTLHERMQGELYEKVRKLSSAGILAVFLSIDVFAALAVPAVGAANYFLNKKLNGLRYERAMARNRITRRKEYAGRVFGRREYAMEMRMGGFAVGMNAVWKLFLQVNSLIMGVAGLQEHSMYRERFRTFAQQDLYKSGKGREGRHNRRKRSRQDDIGHASPPPLRAAEGKPWGIFQNLLLNFWQQKVIPDYDVVIPSSSH